MGGAVEVEGQFYTVVEKSDVIEAASTNGSKFWQAFVVTQGDGQFYTTTGSWHTTASGKLSVMKYAVPRLGKPKNVGKKNESTSEQQARTEFEAMVALKARKRSGERVMPMLAATFLDKRNPKKSRNHKLNYPLLMQPKYDGKRMLCDGTVGWSRGNKDQLATVVAHILPVDTEGMVIDGELLLPHRAPVSEVMSAAQKFHAGISDTMIYMLYDIADLTKSFSERFSMLTDWYARNDIRTRYPHIRLAESVWIKSEADGLATHKEFTDRGFEGSIWRNLDGMYKSDKRVDDLQKHKDWTDEEFFIVDVVPQGEGIGARRAKFICVTQAGDQFESNAMGNEETQLGYLRDRDYLLGKFAVVKYREMTPPPESVPFHSNVREVRETKRGW